MVSVKILNSIVFSIKDFMLDVNSISELSSVKPIETKYALDVLVSHGFVLMSQSKGVHKGKKYNFTYYIASESAKEILLNGGFTKQLSMKEKNVKKIKNNLNINNSTINGQVTQDSSFENSPISNKTNETPIKNEPKSIFERIWKFTDHKLIAQIILIILSLVLGYFGFSYLK